VNVLRNRQVALGFTILFVAANYIWNDIFQYNQLAIEWGGYAFTVVGSLVSAGWLFLTYRRVSGAEKHFWLLLFLGSLAFLLGESIYFCYDTLLRVDPPSPSPDEFFWLFQALFYMIALFYHMYANKSALRMIRLVFDTLIVFTVAASLSFQYIMEPILQSPTFSENWLFLAVYVSYPILDLGMLFGLMSIFLASHGTFSAKTFFYIFMGFAVQIVADSSYLYLMGTDAYEVGSVIDPLWLLVLLMIGQAGMFVEQRISAPQRSKYSGLKTIAAQADYVRLLVPYFGVGLLFAVMFTRIQRMDAVAVGAALSILLVVIRQIITLFENEKLLQKLQHITGELEQKVEQRTEELSLKNTELVETLKKVEHLAYHDTLSGLPNRQLFEEKLYYAIEAAKESDHKVAVLFLDLDRFKTINDHLGHAYGDALLKQVAQRLKQLMGRVAVVSRQGGDEFIVVVCDVQEPQEVSELAQRILHELSQPYEILNQEFHITTSIGIALYPNDGSDVITLMRHADTAMYRAKGRGKNNYQFFDPSMDDNLQLNLENDLRKAIEREELLVHYQPRVSVLTGELMGMEALVRWNRPGHGLVSPGQFIPLAEEIGFIIPMGEWVLREACRQNKAWQEAGLPKVRVAVNLSPLQFQEANFTTMVTQVLQETELDPCFLELEITESMAMHDVEVVIEKLNELKQLGIEIAMDDFGTGYSSLGYLSKLPIDTLKIDQSFIKAIDQAPEEAAIVTAITAMGLSLKLKVLAEGVEEESQLNFLRNIGCHEMQGYLFSRPLSAEDFERLLTRLAQTIAY